MHLLISNVIERWIIETEQPNSLQLLYMLARHTTNAGRRKRFAAFLSNSVSAMECERSNSLKELSQYCESALNAAMDLRDKLPAMIQQECPLDKMCRKVSAAYRKFLSSPQFRIGGSGDKKDKCEEKKDERDAESSISRSVTTTDGQNCLRAKFSITDYWIGFLCELYASALIKINPLLNWRDALRVFDIYRAPPIAAVLVTQSIAHSLGEDYHTGLDLAELALKEGQIGAYHSPPYCFSFHPSSLHLLTDFSVRPVGSCEECLGSIIQPVTICSKRLFGAEEGLRKSDMGD
jgi:hypothetical protein